MTKTTMSTDLLQALQIITKLRVDTVGENLRVFAIDNITLTIEEPRWDLVLSWVLDDGNDSLQFFGGELTGTISHDQLLLPPSKILCLPLVEIDISLLADQVGVTTSDTLYLGQGVHDLLLPFDIGIEET